MDRQPFDSQYGSTAISQWSLKVQQHLLCVSDISKFLFGQIDYVSSGGMTKVDTALDAMWANKLKKSNIFFCLPRVSGFIEMNEL